MSSMVFEDDYFCDVSDYVITDVDDIVPPSLKEVIAMEDSTDIRDIIGAYVEELCGSRPPIAEVVCQNIYGTVTSTQLWNGTICREEKYGTKFGQKHGIYQRWDGGELVTDETYVEGKLHGMAKHWDGYGEPVFEEHYMNGTLHGPCKYWWSDRGETWLGKVITYKHGKKEHCIHYQHRYGDDTLYEKPDLCECEEEFYESEEEF